MFNPIEVKALPHYRLWLRYADGVKGEVDLSYLVGRGVFSAWDDHKVFENVHIGARGAITWKDDIDLCPDALYLRLTGQTPEEAFPKLNVSELHA